jgi:hypothetical protein
VSRLIRCRAFQCPPSNPDRVAIYTRAGDHWRRGRHLPKRDLVTAAFLEIGNSQSLGRDAVSIKIIAPRRSASALAFARSRPATPKIPSGFKPERSAVRISGFCRIPGPCAT